MSLKRCLYPILSVLFTAFCCFSSPVLQAQIRTDGTVGSATSLSGPDYRIGADLGKQARGNLFHSFSEFNIHTGQSATFTGPDSVENIISRVTGGTPSQIDGLLRSEIFGANLFLLNPAGLMFGSGASLDISGSLHLSTADCLKLGSEGRFDAAFPEKDLLTAAPPQAFGFLRDSPGDIQISGNLSVPQNRDISLSGGAIEISNSIVSAPGGHIRMFGTASPEELPLSWSPETELSAFEKLADISLSDGAMVNTGAARAGEIYIQSENFLLRGETSSISAVTGDSDGRGIDILTRGNISLTQGATLFTASLGQGAAGDISLSSDSLIIDSGMIFSDTGTLMSSDSGIRLIGGNGDGGDIRINARSGDIRGGLISTNTLDTGKAGDISISGESLKIRHQGKIVADNGNVYIGEDGTVTGGMVIGGKGDSGNISLNLSTLEMDTASISSNTLGKGEGGTVSITADTLDISGSGRNDPELPDDSYYGIGSQSLESGKGGHIRITAGELNLTKDGMISGQTYGSGSGGDIVLNVKRLNLSQGGTVTASTRGSGDSGDISITAGESANISGTGVRIGKSWIYTATHSSGNGGMLDISAPVLSLSDSGTIYAGTLGDHPVPDMKDGKGGDIALSTDRLELNSGGMVSSESLSKGDAGNIYIHAGDAVILDHAGVKTSAEYADGGEISIRATNTLRLSSSAVTASVSGGQGNGGNIEIDPRFVILNSSSIKASAYGGNGGNIHIVADQFVRSSGSIVDASSELGIDGETKIESPDTDIGGGLAVLPQDYTDASRWLRTVCADRSGEDISRLAETQRDAIPTSPDDWLASPAPRFESDPDHSGDSLLLRGEKFYHKGDFGGAIRLWEQTLPRLNPDHALYLHTLIYLSHGYQAVGYHRKALAAFSRVLHYFASSSPLSQRGAGGDCCRSRLFSKKKSPRPPLRKGETNLQSGVVLPVFEKSSDPKSRALFFSALGDIHLSLGNRKDAHDCLETALAEARRTETPYILSSVLNNRGNLFAAEKDVQNAMAAYQESLEQSEQSDRCFHLRSKAALNRARLIVESEIDTEQDMIRLLEDILLQIREHPDTHDSAQDRISLSLLAQKVRKKLKSRLSSQSDARLRSLVSNALEEARNIAQPLQDFRTCSCACGYLGEFWEEENSRTALNLTRKAVFFAQQQYCPEILYHWQRQLGRLLASRGDTDQAILSYQHAADTLNPIRTEFFRGYRDTRPVFYEKIKPVYMELAELLLKNNDPEKDRLLRARDTMELLKTAELEDFFQDECLIASQKKIQKPAEFAPPHTAIIYPISLPDRLEILVSMPNLMKQVTVPETSADLRKRAQIFYERLTAGHSDRYKVMAGKLYEILIQPLEAHLRGQAIDTLIIVPDDVLRLIPFSALMNPADKRFLIETYAIGTVPALTLNDNEAARHTPDKILLCGLSEGNPPLPRVPEELENIRDIMGTAKVLLNEKFTVSRLSDEFRSQTYPFVHMATHGEFSGMPEKTFLAAYNDGRITMDDLENLIRTGTVRGSQTELLTFSACQTAAGDERAALGLAGLTVRAGARSAIATLWSVADEAASETITEFYRRFRGGVSKAKSLQYAQKKCIESEKYRHPAYWAPFLLIGNWM